MADTASPLSPAYQCLRDGDLDGAEHVCLDVIQDDATDAKAWHLLGVVNAQRNELPRAVECFEKATALRKDVASYHYNLGLAHKGLNDLEPAIAAYRAAVEIKPDFLEAQNNLGNGLLENDQLTEAVDHFRKLGEQFPDESIVHYNLANVLQDAGEYEDCITEFRRAIELDPDFETARENLGRALSDVTRYDEALEVWKDWLEHDPQSAFARHMIAAVTGEGTPDRCDDEYVRGTFDENFAKSYEKQLERIQYSVPDLIRDAIASLELAQDGLNVLDAGCGTGLCVSVLRPLAAQLIGVDLSADMLLEAEKLAAYDRLEERELTAFLSEGTHQFDLIVSGDTLCYFGRLDEVLAAAETCLAPKGHLIFSVEELPPPDDAVEPGDYELQPNGRYRHHENYVRQCVPAAGLELVGITKATLRMERGREVAGLIVIASKP